MSRVGKVPVVLPAGVSVEMSEGELRVKGAKSTLKMQLRPEVVVTVEDGKAWVKPANDSNAARAMWGMTRNILQNLVVGVSKGFTKRLEVQGVGYRVAVNSGMLSLSLGFSHEIRYAIPEGITITSDKPTSFEISGADKQRVGQIAAEIRSLRKPEPYKGKGVRYEGEYIRRKEGKKK
jgi:large subunit ribosomal protein L6